MSRIAIVGFCAVLAACGGQAGSPPAPDARAVAIAAMNRGLASLERKEFEEAVNAFEGALAARPGWRDAKWNLAVALFDGDGDVDRAVATRDGVVLIATAAPAGNHWVAFALEGNTADNPPMWSPKSGPDEELEVRAGDLWTMLRARATTGFLSTIESVARFGLGDRATVDYLRSFWPDRAVQAELGIAAGFVVPVVEYCELRRQGW